jgi:SAM-dependent methyltransferase
MDLASTDRVLEVGYGPGLALESVLPRIPDGQVVGLDHSVTMRHAAAARNRGAVADGRLTLRVGEVENLASSDDPILAGPFDRIFAVNVAMFWKNQEQVFGLLAGRLATGGRIFITVQPRTGERTDEAARAAAEKLAASMGAAGLANIRIETLPELSPMAVCVVGGKQPPDAGQTLNLNSITSPSWTT